jgi:hypothetical protein
MKRIGWISAALACALCAATAAEPAASDGQAGQTAKPKRTQRAAPKAPRDKNPSMVKPPPEASGPGTTGNRYNMPVVRPSTPTRDRMVHDLPASGAIAK